MKFKTLLLIAMIFTLAFPVKTIAQENDDMYFSSRDREVLYASAALTENISANSYYTANSNKNKSGEVSDANNQYFIKDYSLINKPNNEIKTYAGINSSNGFQSGYNVVYSFSMFYISPRYGSRYGSYYNPLSDPFSPYYDPFYSYNNPWLYSSYAYNPWQYNNYNTYGYSGTNYNSSSCFYPSNGYTSYSRNVVDQIKYRNGRKVIARSSRSVNAIHRTSTNPNSRPTISTDGKVSSSGRSSGRDARSTYRRYQNNSSKGTPTIDSRSYNRTNNSSTRSSTKNRNTNTSYRSNNSSSSSSSPKPSYSSGSSRSSSTPRSSSSGSSSRSTGNRGRGN